MSVALEVGVSMNCGGVLGPGRFDIVYGDAEGSQICYKGIEPMAIEIRSLLARSTHQWKSQIENEIVK